MFDLLHSFTRLVHSFVVETHGKFCDSLFLLQYFDSDDLRRRKGPPKNLVAIENDYSKVLVIVGFHFHLSNT